jgi:hypothetical protein
VTGLGLEIRDNDEDTFPLPTLAKELKTKSEQLHNGKGVVVVRGMNPADFSGEDNSLIFMGISAYVAKQRGRQDQRGSMIGTSTCPLYPGPVTRF